MSGDVIDVAVKAFYKDQTYASPNNSVNDVLNALANGAFGLTGGAKGTLDQLSNTSTSPLLGALNSFIGSNNPIVANKPKAYLNWILLDEQFQYVSSYPQSGALAVGNYASNVLNTLAYTGIPITKNGYLYIYVNNETPGWDVFFDNMSVKHYSGAITEETHYYPFGLTMAGISSKAAAVGNPENKYKYNGYELNSDFDLNLYESFYRSHDPQLGRFWQIDPKPTETQSLYSAMNNNPILINDILGDTGRIGTMTDAVIKVNGKEYNGKDLVNGLVKEWSKITGLKLSLDKDGNLVNGGVATNKGISKTARQEVLNLIKSDGTVYIDFNGQISSQTLDIKDPKLGAVRLNPAEIGANVDGTSKDLNSLTFGAGMTALHELGHTFLHGNFGHGVNTLSSFGVIDAPDQLGNKIRSELGPNWGQRLSYTSLPFNGSNYVPMTQGSLQMLQNAIPQITQAMRRNPLVQATELSNVRMPTSGVIIVRN